MPKAICASVRGTDGLKLATWTVGWRRTRAMAIFALPAGSMRSTSSRETAAWTRALCPVPKWFRAGRFERVTEASTWYSIRFSDEYRRQYRRRPNQHWYPPPRGRNLSELAASREDEPREAGPDHLTG